MDRISNPISAYRTTVSQLVNPDQIVLINRQLRFFEGFFPEIVFTMNVVKKDITLRSYPVFCLEALLLAKQLARIDVLKAPSEFLAYVIESDLEIIVLYQTDDVAFVARDELVEYARAEAQQGKRLIAHLHNHPFYLDRLPDGDIAGGVFPSSGDLPYYKRLTESGLVPEQIWITNGFNTYRFATRDLDRYFITTASEGQFFYLKALESALLPWYKGHVRQ